MKQIGSYTIALFEDGEHYYAKLVNAPGHCTGHGDSPDAALSDLADAMEIYLHEARKDGLEVPYAPLIEVK